MKELFIVMAMVSIIINLTRMIVKDGDTFSEFNAIGGWLCAIAFSIQ